jgi:hypothetical protein
MPMPEKVGASPSAGSERKQSLVARSTHTEDLTHCCRPEWRLNTNAVTYDIDLVPSGSG